MSKKPANPCYGCTKRCATCHANCETYLQYREAQIEFSEFVQQSKWESSYTFARSTRSAAEYRGIARFRNRNCVPKPWAV